MLKALLTVFGLTAVLAVLFVGYFVATFEPNRYIERIVDVVSNATGRTLTIEGDIHVAFFPNLGMAVSGISLSEPESDKLFLQAQEVHVSLKLVPLLSKRVEVDAVNLRGFTARVVRSKQGRLNFEDLLGFGGAGRVEGRIPAASESPTASGPAEAGPKDIAVHIEGIEMEDGVIEYTDEVEGRKLSISALNVRTGPIADGVPSHVQAAFTVKADVPHLDLGVRLQTGFRAESDTRRIGLTDFDIGLRGVVMGITDLDAAMKGTVESRWAVSELNLSQVRFAAAGRWKEDGFQLKLNMPGVILTGDEFRGDRVDVDAVLEGAGGKLEVGVKVPGIHGSGKSFSTGPIDVAVKLEGGGRSMSSTLRSAISGSIEAGTFELPRFTAAAHISDPSLPVSPVQAEIEGLARVDLNGRNAAMDFFGKLDDGRVEGRVGLIRFDPPAYTFDVRFDQLDVDRYMGWPAGPNSKAAHALERGEGAEKGCGVTSKPIDLSVLQGITAEGSFQAGRIKALNIRAVQVRADIKAAGGRLDVGPLSAGLYGGGLSGSFSAQSASTPLFIVKQRLSGVDMGQLLRDAAGNDRFEGKGDISVDLTARGDTEAALKKGLDGRVSLLISDGSVRGIDLVGMLRDAKNRLRELRGQKTVGESRSEKTAFSELKATLDIKNGVARNNDLMVKAPPLRITGEGVIDIGNDRIDYLVKPTVVGTTRGQSGYELAELSGVTIPVRIQGHRTDPRYTIDYSGLAIEYGRGLLDRTREDVTGRGGRKIEDRLRGILRR